MRTPLWLMTLLSLSLTGLLARPEPGHARSDVQIRRFALLAGANRGGPDRVRLRYAVSDAKALGNVLETLGGVQPADQMLLEEPDRAAFERQLRRLRRRLESARTEAEGGRIELLVYYSGHADEKGLLMGGDRLPYGELKAAIEALPADVRITIVDACASGALTRSKGGVRRPAFLVDAGSQVSGSAILTSASEDEAAQESDRVRGSYFTHALTSGLRGAADVSGDRRVTLSEAYQYAYHETLARTERSRIGAQHPGYDLQLKGQGDVVLTDLRGSESGLVLHEALGGRLYVRDRWGTLVAELNKPEGRRIDLGVEPGDYKLTLERGGRLGRAELTLSRGEYKALETKDFEATEGYAFNVARGDTAPAADSSTSASVEDAHTRVVALSFVPPLSTNHMFADVEGEVDNRVAFAALVGYGRNLRGAEGAGLGNIRSGHVTGVQGSGLFNIAQLGVRGVQGTGLLNVSGGEVHGVQAAGLLNLSRGPVKGVQAAGLFNMADGRVRGVQAAALFNIAEANKGAQVAGLFTRSNGEVRGVQAAGLFSIADGPVHGAQIGGLFTRAHDVRGVQIGLVNVADSVRGLQIGLVNVADSVKGAPIGLVNLIGDGIRQVEVFGNEISTSNVAARLGGKHFYTLIGFGAIPESGSRKDTTMAGLGLGGRLLLDGPGLTLDTDLSVWWLDEEGGGVADEYDQLVRLQITAGWQLWDHMTLFGGPTLTASFSTRRAGDDLALVPLLNTHFVDQNKRVNVGLWPGLVAGIRFF